MKRKPIEITAGLLNILNSFQTNRDYNINEIKQKTGFHWQTISDYILLIQLIQEFGAKIKINPKTNKIQILSPSNYLEKLTIEEQMIVFLFIEKAFDDFTSIPEVILFNSFPQNDIETIINSPFIITILSHNMKRKTNPRFYLSQRGKYKAQGILSSINRKIAEFIDKKADIEIASKSKIVIKPFQNESELKITPSSSQNKIRETPSRKKDIKLIKTSNSFELI